MWWTLHGSVKVSSRQVSSKLRGVQPSLRECARALQRERALEAPTLSKMEDTDQKWHLQSFIDWSKEGVKSKQIAIQSNFQSGVWFRLIFLLNSIMSNMPLSKLFNVWISFLRMTDSLHKRCKTQCHHMISPNYSDLSFSILANHHSILKISGNQPSLSHFSKSKMSDWLLSVQETTCKVPIHERQVKCFSEQLSLRSNGTIPHSLGWGDKCEFLWLIMSPTKSFQILLCTVISKYPPKIFEEVIFMNLVKWVFF